MPMKMKSGQTLGDYKAVIFDLDGTLYFQPKMRRKMAFRLAGYHLLHPGRVRDLFLLYRFRAVRERWQEIELPDALRDLALSEAQYRYVASLEGVTPGRVRETVERWMYREPLRTLAECKDRKLGEVIEDLRNWGIPVLVYSDYPVEDKLKALQIEADGKYCALDSDIMCLKPDAKGLLQILRKWRLSPSEAIMIGDRDSRDGQAARNAGMDYIVLDRRKRGREKLYQVLVERKR